MDDLAKLDDLMQRANGVVHSKKQQDQREAKAIRDSYAPEIAALKRAEAAIREHLPEAKRIEGYVDKFPWHLVRERGQPAEIGELLGELRRCSSLGLNSIRGAREKIDSFGADDVHLKWRPSRDVSAVVATAGHMREVTEALKRQLEYWGKRLEEKLPPIEGHSEAIEGNAPPDGGDDITVISNRPE